MDVLHCDERLQCLGEAVLSCIVCFIVMRYTVMDVIHCDERL